MPIRVAALCFAGLIAVELSGCALWRAEPDSGLWVDAVLSSERAERPALWRSLQERDDAMLPRLLLQSLPGHPGHAPSRARQGMLELLQNGRLELADQRLLRLRLLDLKQEMALQEALRERDERLRSLIQIEQELQQGQLP